MKKKARHTQLLEVAKKVFAEKGYHASTVDDIVTAAGVARGTFYLYFKDKRGAFEELVDVVFGQLAAAIIRVETDSDASVESQVRQNLTGIFAVLLEDRAMTKILLADAVGLDPAFDQKLIGFYDGVQRMLQESLAEGQRLGIVAEGDVRVYAMLTLGALKEALYQIVLRGLDWHEHALTETTFRFLKSGYLRV